MCTRLRVCIPVLCLALVGFLPGCQSDDTGSETAKADPAPAPASADKSTARVGDDRTVDTRTLSRADQQQFQTAWRHFQNRSAVWPLYRDEWLEKGGAAPYVLSENLFGYFWRAALVGQKSELPRIAETARVIGEPAVAYFAKALVTDSWPLKKPITTEVMDPDDLNGRIKKTFHKFIMDDETRRWAAGILAEIGTPAIPTLASHQLLYRSHPTSRRYAAYALGTIGTPAAVDALTRKLLHARGGEWQDRAAAATALGLTVSTSEQAKQVLLQAAESDRDEFVRKKANRALASADKVKFW